MAQYLVELAIHLTAVFTGDVEEEAEGSLRIFVAESWPCFAAEYDVAIAEADVA